MTTYTPKPTDVIVGQSHVPGIVAREDQVYVPAWALPGGAVTTDLQTALVVAENIDKVIRR